MSRSWTSAERSAQIAPHSSHGSELAPAIARSLPWCLNVQIAATRKLDWSGGSMDSLSWRVMSSIAASSSLGDISKPGVGISSVACKPSPPARLRLLVGVASCGSSTIFWSCSLSDALIAVAVAMAAARFGRDREAADMPKATATPTENARTARGGAHPADDLA